jgi:hypothetical protein
MPDVPILGQKKANGGQPVQVLPEKYLAEIVTADGTKHLHTFDLGVSLHEDGSPDLSKLRDLDPKNQFLEGFARQVFMAHRNPNAPVAMDVDSGARICVLHVVSWRYVGPADLYGRVDSDKALEASIADAFRGLSED